MNTIEIRQLQANNCPVKVAIFDFDGTISNSYPIFLRIFKGYRPNYCALKKSFRAVCPFTNSKPLTFCLWF